MPTLTTPAALNRSAGLLFLGFTTELGYEVVQFLPRVESYLEGGLLRSINRFVHNAVAL